MKANIPKKFKGQNIFKLIIILKQRFNRKRGLRKKTILVCWTKPVGNSEAVDVIKQLISMCNTSSLQRLTGNDRRS